MRGKDASAVGIICRKKKNRNNCVYLHRWVRALTCGYFCRAPSPQWARWERTVTLLTRGCAHTSGSRKAHPGAQRTHRFVLLHKLLQLIGTKVEYSSRSDSPSRRHLWEEGKLIHRNAADFLQLDSYDSDETWIQGTVFFISNGAHTELVCA